MTTAAGMRKIALSLPEVEERSHFEKPDFRVCNKIFAGLSRDGRRANVKLTPELQALILDAKPDAYFPAEGGWGRSGWTYVELAEVEVDELKELVLEAYRIVAPKRLGERLASRANSQSTRQSAAPTRAAPRARVKAKASPAPRASRSRHRG